MKRIDLVVNRYTRNDETGLEKNEWIVIIGTPDASSPKVPQHTIGNLQNGDLIDDCPVFEVHYDGINVTEVKKLLPVMSNLDLLNGNIISAEHKDIGIHAVNAGSYTDIAVDLKQFGMSKIVSVIPIMQGRSSSSSYGLLTLGLYEFNQNTATLRAFNADGVKREPRINVCVIGFKQQ